MVEAAEAKVPPEVRDGVRCRVAAAAPLPFEEAAYTLVAQATLPASAGETPRVVRPGGRVVVASRLGAATPCCTPDAVLRRGFAERGLETVAPGGAGAGTY